MPPKKKKGRKKKGPTAAELEAMRLAEEEAERKRLEEEERERQRLLWEEELKRRAGVRAELQVELDARLAKCREEDASMLAERASILQRADDIQLQKEEWAKFLDCSNLPNAHNEGELNTYIRSWAEKNELDMEQALQDIQDAESINHDLLQVVGFALERGLTGRVEVLRELMYDLRDVTLVKCDESTANVLMYAEEMTSENNVLQKSSNMADIKFGLWVNQAKNLRLKKIEYEDLNFWFDLPKALVLANVAIRSIHFNYDHLSHRVKPPHRPIGGVFTLDLMAVPPPPLQVKGWTMRQMNGAHNNLVYIPYPLPPTGAEYAPQVRVPLGQQGGPSFRVSYEIPKHIVMRDENPRVGWWDEEYKIWSTDGIGEVWYDKDTRIVKFETSRMASYSIMQDRFEELPFESWLIQPNGQNKATFTLETASEVIKIQIEDGLCHLLEPAYPELDYLREPHRPGHLLLQLVQSGFLVMPEMEDVCQVEDLVAKIADVESSATFQIAHCAAAFDVMSSRWNHKRPENEVVFRIREHTEQNKVLPPPDTPKGDVGWSHIMVDELGVCVMSECPEPVKEEGYPTSTLEITEWKTEGGVSAWCDILSHEYQTMALHCFSDVEKWGELVQPMIRSSSPDFQECVRYLLLLTKALVFQRPIIPLPEPEPEPEPEAEPEILLDEDGNPIEAPEGNENPEGGETAPPPAEQ